MADQMFANILGVTEGIELKEPKLKIAIIGEPKTGKSWLAATAPGPVFVADFDGRKESLRGKKDVYVKSYTDLNPSTPIAISAFETDIAMFEYMEQQGKPIPATFVCDSMTYMRAACEHELIKQHPAMSRKIKLGTNEIKIPSGWDIINGNRAYMEYIIGRLSLLGHVICVFHEAAEKDVATSTKEEKKYTGRTTVQPQYLASILSLFNEVWRVSLDYQNNYIVQIKPNNEFLASSTLTLDAVEKPNIQMMLAKHKLAHP